jgi:cell division septation protein DedD
VKAGIARGWTLVAAATLVAVLAVGGMVTFVRLQTLTELPQLALPTSPTRTAATIPPVLPPATQHFAIQIASFQTFERAELLLDQLASLGFEARATQVNAGEFGRLVEVLVGDYLTSDAATPDLSKLRSVHGFVDAQVAPIFSVETR